MASCSTTAPAERYQIHTSRNPGVLESATAGTAITTMRVTDATSDGIVLPIAWNMLEQTKISPENANVSDTMRRYSSPTAITAASFENTRMSAAGKRLHITAISSIQPTAIMLASLNTALTRPPSRAPTFWPATGATEKPSATTGMNNACTTRMPMPNPACAAAPNGRDTA